MKVLQLGKFYPIEGGVEKVMYDLMTGLSQCGMTCDMVCASDIYGSKIMSVNEHARLVICKALVKKAATMISPEMIRCLRKVCHEYDIVHVHHPDPMACLALFCSGYKGKVVVHWHSDICKQKALLRFYIPLQKWLLRRADVIVGTTPVYLEESPFLRGFSRKFICLPIGIDTMVPVQKQVAEIRKTFEGKKIVFSLGRLVAYKGYSYLVDAACYLGDDYVILIGGTGRLRVRLQEQIDSLNLNARVRLLDFIPDDLLPAYYEACDLFCLSSVQKTEAFGIVQIEAMSFGKPVVATTIPHSGVSWVNKHGVSGLNVRPKDARAIAEAIMTITNDETIYRTYSRNAKERYKRMFTKDAMVGKCRKIYENLLDN
ncbi:MAG: glycosyltransferase [Bacteroides sp.]|nr:glycosyltransferase [Roseburia sp.]MCM1346007.1 glycosyltransferase [Bacteroides sp.]